MSSRLSVLIPTIDGREQLLNRLCEVLKPQADEHNVILMILKDDKQITTGEKRNIMIEGCITKYCVFVDDDDVVSSDYLSHIIRGIDTGADAIGFKGVITSDGRNPNTFIHSDRYSKWYEERTAKGIVYCRPINHICPIKTEIARQIKYKHITFGEDKDYSDRLKQSGLIRREYFIDHEIYFYQYTSKQYVQPE